MPIPPLGPAGEFPGIELRLTNMKAIHESGSKNNLKPKPKTFRLTVKVKRREEFPEIEGVLGPAFFIHWF